MPGLGPGPSRRPDRFAVADALGAAIAQVSDEVVRVCALAEMTREAALNDAEAPAKAAAVAAGARSDTIEIVGVGDVPLTHLPGNATRARVKALGEFHVCRLRPTAARLRPLTRSNADSG